MCMTEWKAHWFNDILPCTGKCFSDIMPLLWFYIPFNINVIDVVRRGVFLTQLIKWDYFVDCIDLRLMKDKHIL